MTKRCVKQAKFQGGQKNEQIWELLWTGQPDAYDQASGKRN